nr:methyltransferase domain-containing protein [Dyella sedimenti]
MPRIPSGGRLLDLGGGYGRLGSLVSRERPDIELVGQDLALSYCRLYRDVTPCVQGSMFSLPFAEASFDGVLAITCLMYGQHQVFEALKGIHLVMKPGGVLLALDPGKEMQQVISFVRRRKSESPTGGIGFRLAEYISACQRAGFRIVSTGGNPFLSMALLMPGVAASSKQKVEALLAWVSRRDQFESGYSALALHRWMLGVKESAATAFIG